MPKSLFQCITSFVCLDFDGVRTRVGLGDVVPAGDWRLSGREQFFAPIEASTEAPIQTASATPGTKSVAKRIAKRDTAEVVS